MGSMDTLAEIARILDKGDNLTKREKAARGLIENAIKSHFTNTLISLVTLTEVVERIRPYRKPVKEALDKIKRGGSEEGEDDFRYDDIVNDLYGPPPKLQAISEVMCDGAHELDVNVTGLGAILTDIYREYNEVIDKYKTPFIPPVTRKPEEC